MSACQNGPITGLYTLLSDCRESLHYIHDVIFIGISNMGINPTGNTNNSNNTDITRIDMRIEASRHIDSGDNV